MTFFEGPRAIVVDASVAVDVIDGVAGWPDRWQVWRVADAQLLAPHHLRLEVANAFLRGTRREPGARVIRRVQLLFETGVDLVDRGLPGLLETVELAERHGLTVYDAAYLQLALDCDAEIATQDPALGKAAAAEGLVVHT